MSKCDTTEMSENDSPPEISEMTTIPTTSSSRRGPLIFILKQHMASVLANLPSMSTGIALGWTSPAVPILLGQVEDPQPLRLSLEQASWVGGIVPLTSLVGALVAGPLAEKLGRKRTLMLSAVPTILGWLLILFTSSSVWMLMVGRFLTGLSVGAVSGPVALYCEEIADVRVRGALGTYQFLLIAVGCTWMYGLGCLLTYFWFTTLALLPSLVFILSFSWMPESPAYLSVNGRKNEAQRALRWFRGPDIDCDFELQMLLAAKSKMKDSSNEQPPKSFISLCSRRPWQSNALRGFAILACLMFFQQMTGVALFMFYTVQVFQEAGGNVSSHFSMFISAGIVTVGGVILSNVTVDRVGRRKLLITSFVVLAISLIFVLVYSCAKENGWNFEQWKWVPLASFTVYFLAFGIGAGPIPWFLLAELLPMYAKGWGSPGIVCLNRIFMFLVTKQAPLMFVYAGEIPTYAMFSAFCFVAALFVIFFVPETKGKTKPDIIKAVGGNNP